MLFHPVGQVCGMSFPTIAPCSSFGPPFAVTLYLQSAGKDLSNGLSDELQAHVLEGAMSLAPSNSQDQTAYRDKIQHVMSAVFSDWKMWQEANISETSEGLSLRVESDGEEIPSNSAKKIASEYKELVEQSNWASLLPAKPTEGVRGTAGAYSATRRFLAIGRLPVAAQQFLAPLAAMVMDEARRGPAADGSPAKKKEYTGREEREVISTKLATTVKLGQYFGLQSVLVQYRAAAQPGKTTADLIGHSKEAISVFSPAEAKTMKVPVEYMVAKMARWAFGQPKTHLWPALQ